MMLKGGSFRFMLVCSLLIAFTVVTSATRVTLEGHATPGEGIVQEGQVNIKNTGRKTLQDNHCDDNIFAATGCFFGGAANAVVDLFDGAVDASNAAVDASNAAYDEYADAYNSVSSSSVCHSVSTTLVVFSGVAVAVLGMI